MWSYESLFTPTITDEFMIIGKQFLEDQLKLIKSNKWKPYDNTGKVLLEELHISNSNISAIKASMVYHVKKHDDIERIADMMYSSSLKEKKKMYDEIIKNDIIKEIDNNNMIIHSQFNSPIGFGFIKPREFVALKSRMLLDDGSYLITACSINYQDIPFSPGFVRGIGRTAMLISSLGDTQFKITKVDHMDPKGWIPSHLINKLKGKNGKRLERIKAYL